jgi:hypothetical protein
MDKTADSGSTDAGSIPARDARIKVDAEFQHALKAALKTRAA